ncbi:sal-like protein 3 [Drosophila sulfurigaster albostrigata]|uniref:sal-like protein 3 n=1 Tax=Drosophila sulfurigaster albostrigata TaxID=89887 RepID=UPI002D21D1E0|nr:sal-like protein 3 [Drosophila sulfurigaster albostrigata]
MYSMEGKSFKTMFGLPTSPESSEDYNTDTSDDDVEFVGTYLMEAMTDQGNVPNITSNLGKMATVLTTPPMSPQDIHNLQPKDMPSLTAMLSNNYSGHTPTGYIVHIPCFLCKEPFNNINSLKEHLTMHAKQLNGTLINNPRPTTQSMLPTDLFSGAPLISTSTEHAIPLGAPTPIPPTSVTMPATEPTETLTCEICGRVLRSMLGLTLHVRSHYNPDRQKYVAKPFKCHMCRKSYRRQSNLQKHMTCRHGIRPITEALPPLPRPTADPVPTLASDAASAAIPTAAATAAPTAAAESPAVRQTVPRPIQPPPDDELNIKPSKTIIWSTKLLNAVAAANYSPAVESASKYIAPTEESSQPSIFRPPPKQKYALRSPFCNPNLWADYDNHIP